MVRRLLIVAGALALAAPLIHAQDVTVCVFQAERGHKMQNSDDAQRVASALSALTLPGGAAIKAIPVTGVSAKDEEAEAGKRGCGFILEVWRNEVPAATPMGPGTNAVSGSQAGIYAEGSGPDASTVMEYSLLKAGSHKKLGSGEASKRDPWSQAADLAAKKIAKAK